MAKVGCGWWYKVLGFSCVTAMQAEWPVYAIINNVRLCVKNNFIIKLHIYQENCTNYAKA